MRRPVSKDGRKRCEALVKKTYYRYGRRYNRNQPSHCSNYAQEGQDYCGIHLKMKMPPLKTEVPKPDDTEDIDAAIKRWKNFYGLKR